MQNCLRELSIWFHENSLQLNPLKTEVMYVNHTSKHFNIVHFFIWQVFIIIITNEKNLGVILNSNHDMKSFISEKIRSVNLQLYRIKKIRKSLNFFTCKIVVTSLVLGVFDNCLNKMSSSSTMGREGTFPLQTRSAIGSIYIQ